MEQRKRWQELDRAALDGPWEADAAEIYQQGTREWVGETLHEDLDDEHNGIDLAEFIAAARTGWPAAERECEQFRKLLRNVRRSLLDDDRWVVTLDLIDSSGLLSEAP